MNTIFIICIITLVGVYLQGAQVNGQGICEDGKFNCTNGRCIKPQYVCDGDNDCGDSSDEVHCKMCGPSMFQCKSGGCISGSFECDGDPDCPDVSDEANCGGIEDSSPIAFIHTTETPVICNPGQFACLDRLSCVPEAAICNSVDDCADQSDEFHCPGNQTRAIWQEHWHDHRENLSLAYVDAHVAVYYDPMTSHSITWPFVPLSEAWQYVKASYGPFGDDPHLYVVLHTGKHAGCHMNTFLHERHGHRNVIDCGITDQPNGWSVNSTVNMKNLLTTFGHVIRAAAKGDWQDAGLGICDELMREILSYDVYIKIRGQTDEIIPWKTQKLKEIRNGRHCFKNWFLPIYEKYGGVSVLNNFYALTSAHAIRRERTATDTGVGFTRFNMAEFIHFWSGAAGDDLEPFARAAFGWTNEREMGLARAKFPQVGLNYTVTVHSRSPTSDATTIPSTPTSATILAQKATKATTTFLPGYSRSTKVHNGAHRGLSVFLGIVVSALIIGLVYWGIKNRNKIFQNRTHHHDNIVHFFKPSNFGKLRSTHSDRNALFFQNEEDGVDCPNSENDAVFV